MLVPVSRRTSTRVRRRAGRAAGALFVVAVTAFGPHGPGIMTTARVHAVGTVTQSGQAVVPAAAAMAVAEAATPTMGTVTAGDPGTATVLPGSAVIGTPTLTPTPATATATAVPPSAPSGSGIPGTVLAAYRDAEAALGASNPGCRVSWSLIAGIGRVESGHASGGRVDAAGTTNGRILGPELNGTSTALIRDTDGGALDGDTAFDRAVGPMQFIPGTWKTFATDGNRDGVASPHNVFDAALAAGTYLCAGGGDLSQPAAQRAALLRYNRSDAYGVLVLRWAAAYAGGVAVLPNEQGEVPTTTPTPPAQVPTPAAGTIDPATSAALAAPAPPVTGTVASESSADARSTGSSTTTTTPSTSTPTTPATTTPTTTTTTTPTTPTTSRTTTTTPPTTTRTTTTTPTTTSPPGTSSSSAATTTSRPTTTTSKPTTSTSKATTTSEATSTSKATTTSKQTSSAAKTSAESAADDSTSGDSSDDS
jgi:membrane-bound lytic murein transglycosylase B